VTAGAAFIASVLLLAGLAAAVTPAQAEQLRLEDAIRYALRGSPLLAPANTNVQRAKGALLVARGAFDWNSAAEVGWERLYALKSSNGSVTSSFDTVNTYHETVGLKRAFRNGVSVEPGITVYEGNQALSTQTFGVSKPLPSIRLEVPLLRGLGEQSADAAELAAEQALKGSQLQRAFAAEQAVHDAVQAYWRCAAAYDHVYILSDEEERASQETAILRQQVAKGAADPLSLAQNESDLVMRQVSLERAEDAITSCQRDLALLAGMSGAPAKPVPIDALPLAAGKRPAVILDEQSLIGIANTNRKDLQALNRQISAQAHLLTSAQDQALPKVDVYADLRSAGLRYSQPLEGNLAEGEVEQAMAAKSDAMTSLDALTAKIRVDIASIVQNIREAVGNYATLTASAQSLEGTVAELRRRSQFTVAERPAFLDAEEQLSHVRNEIVDVDLEYAANLASLRFATGTITITEPPAPSSLAALFLTGPRN
jgi:outer membrane protein TolC